MFKYFSHEDQTARFDIILNRAHDSSPTELEAVILHG